MPPAFPIAPWPLPTSPKLTFSPVSARVKKARHLRRKDILDRRQDRRLEDAFRELSPRLGVKHHLVEEVARLLLQVLIDSLGGLDLELGLVVLCLLEIAHFLAGRGLFGGSNFLVGFLVLGRYSGDNARISKWDVFSVRLAYNVTDRLRALTLQLGNLDGQGPLGIHLLDG
jgi:hypothetical protein